MLATGLWIVTKATVILGIAALLALVLRGAAASTRHLVWTTALFAVLALPALWAVLPAWQPSVPAAVGEIAARVAAPVASDAAEARGVAPAPASVQPATPSARMGAPLPDPIREPSRSWAFWAVAAWATGIAVGALALLAGYLSLQRVTARALPITDERWIRAVNDACARLRIRRAVAVLRCHDVVMPAACGLVWPAVLLPPVADEWDGDRRDAVLRHELAHVRRFDMLTQLMAQVACVLLWFHPLVWYAAHRMRLERERACDDLVLQAGTRPAAYANHVLEIASTLQPPQLIMPATVGMARKSQLEGRLLAVLDPKRRRGTTSPRGTRLALAGALLVVVPLATLSIAPTSNAAAAIVPPGASTGTERTAAIAPVTGRADCTRRAADVSLAGIRLIRISTRDGGLQVQGRKGTTDLRLTESACGGSGDARAMTYAEIQRRDTVLRIETEQPRDARNVLHDISVTVPANVAVRVEADGGPLDVRDLLTVRIEDKGGDIAVRNIRGDLRIEDKGGRIEVAGIGGSVRIHSDSGDITVERVTGNLLFDRHRRGIRTWRAIGGFVRMPDSTFRGSSGRAP